MTKRVRSDAFISSGIGQNHFVRRTRNACGDWRRGEACRASIALDPAVLATYVGAYALTPDFAITVTLEDGQLMAQATGQGRFPV